MIDDYSKSFFKLLTIKNSRDFRNLSKSQYKYYGRYVIILCNITPDKYLHNKSLNLNCINFIRIGYTISKKISKLAVKRNKIKRRLKEIARLYDQKYYINHYDYNIIAKSQIIDSDFKEIKKDFEFCIKKLKQKIDAQKN
ncbi:MAG: ribonuclease P protein component [Rickettsiales bacterium]|jgi:ribonuclease P protein component|nr:ribonuclease P protein component [Rickettsiales bacterium]|tara:strand:- start:994 stop:1413 length:420 start_codon:yes stop_codon:yes gene_type:complete